MTRPEDTPGQVAEVDGRWRAWSPNGILIGTYPSRAEAETALGAPYSSDRPNEPEDLGETAFDHGEPRIVDVYDGRNHLGSVAVGRSIRAVTPAGEEIGIYPTIEEARRAVVRHAFSRTGGDA